MAHRVNYGYEPGESAPTAIAGCDSVMVGMAELNNVLEQAYALGLQGAPETVQAVAVYDANTDWASRIWIYVPLSSQCETRTNEVRNAVNKIVRLIEQRTGQRPSLLRPDYVPPSTSEAGFPVWGYAILGVGGIIGLAYVTGQIASVARLWKGSKRVGRHRRLR